MPKRYNFYCLESNPSAVARLRSAVILSAQTEFKPSRATIKLGKVHEVTGAPVGTGGEC